MGYKVEKPEGAPSWFVPGIVCKVWDTNKELGYIRPVAWFQKDELCFVTSDGSLFDHAEPIESWEPRKGEWVAAWDDWLKSFVVGQYEEFDGFHHHVGDSWHQHVARITDGLDLRCTPEELKQRTEWL